MVPLESVHNQDGKDMSNLNQNCSFTYTFTVWLLVTCLKRARPCMLVGVSASRARILWHEHENLK